MISLSDIHEGHKVTVSMGGYKVRHGIVTDTHEDVKNGQPGISFTNDTGDWWAYLDQVVAVTGP